MASYFEQHTNISRGQTTAEKKACAWRKEYFRLDAGLLESVSVFEDKFVYASPAHPFPVPVGAEASTASAYAEAFAKLTADEQRRQRKAWEAAREKYPVLKPEAPLLGDFTVLDTEFVPEGPHLLEVAAIRYINFEPREAFVSFVAFDGYVPRFVTELTGITALHLHGAPAEKKVLGQLREYAGDSLLVCHNVPADRGVIEKTRTRLGAPAELPNAWLCTMALAKRRVKAGLLPGNLKCGLGDLCQHFSIQRRGAHRAKADVQMTFQLLRTLHEQQPVTKGDLHGAPQPGKGRKLSPTGPGLFAAA
jgi:DNA polymerase-3 subunit epsilon